VNDRERTDKALKGIVGKRLSEPFFLLGAPVTPAIVPRHVGQSDLKFSVMLTDLSAFFGAFRQRWLTLMSGAASVPFAFASAFLSSWQQVLSVAAAALFFFYAAFLVWRTDYRRANELDARLKPKFRVGFEPNSDGIFRTPAYGGHSTIFIRGYVESQTEAHLHECTARITKISVYENNQWVMKTDASLPCWWASQDESGDKETVPPGEKCYFNIARVHQGVDRLIPTARIVAQGVWDQLPTNGRFKFRITVSARDAPTRDLEIEIDWKSNLNIAAKRIP
jgi:hypothetical protein